MAAAAYAGIALTVVVVIVLLILYFIYRWIRKNETNIIFTVMVPYTNSGSSTPGFYVNDVSSAISEAEKALNLTGTYQLATLQQYSDAAKQGMIAPTFKLDPTNYISSTNSFDMVGVYDSGAAGGSGSDMVPYLTVVACSTPEGEQSVCAGNDYALCTSLPTSATMEDGAAYCVLADRYPTVGKPGNNPIAFSFALVGPKPEPETATTCVSATNLGAGPNINYFFNPKSVYMQAINSITSITTPVKFINQEITTNPIAEDSTSSSGYSDSYCIMPYNSVLNEQGQYKSWYKTFMDLL